MRFICPSNSGPVSGFVKGSAGLILVLIWETVMSPLAIRSCIHKKRVCMCLTFATPFLSAIDFADVLSDCTSTVT